MRVDTFTMSAGKIAEVYLTVKPLQALSLQSEIEDVFLQAARHLRASNARILQERIFVSQEAVKTASSVRSKVYGELDDGVAPTWLVAPAGINGLLAGVQIHAVSGYDTLDTLKSDNIPCGHVVRIPGLAYLTLSSIRQSDIPGRANQARAMFEKAQSVLNDTGVNFQSVPRTWMWLDNILGWYRDFNLVRNTFFKECGVIAQKGNHRMPASTGIGIRTENGALCAMELAAVGGELAAIEYLNAGGNQESAFEYGSAFSRACRARTPAGHTIYISGTASIGADGKTTYLGDPRGQIGATIDNVRALLKQCHCSDADVVQAVAYSKTPEIEKIFTDGWKDLKWPIVPVVSDICRDDLLYEIEVTAAKKLHP
jgi:enamine deaminase RidA (YjgF/YER057c/UK114 family)